MTTGVVIVGGGQGGVQVADSLRSGGYDGSIALVSSEVGDPYQRPQLSKEFLYDVDAQDPLTIRPLRYLAERDVEVISGVTARDLEPAAREVIFDNGRSLTFDHLVLATGSRNRELSIPGAKLRGVHGLRTLEEARVLRDALNSAKRLVVVGAGFIGLEVASAARKLGLDVTVIDVTDRPMSRVLTETMSDFFADVHLANGVRLILGDGVVGFEGEAGRVETVLTTAGCRLKAEVVVVGVGVIPDTALAMEGGLAVDDGILVDDYLETDVAGISAVGDCARYPIDGKYQRLESVQNAAAQGRYVAERIIGEKSKYRDVPWFWTHQHGLKLQIAGLVQGADEVVLRGDRHRQRFSLFCFKEGELLGVESVNQTADHMAARRILASGFPISSAQAADVAFDLKADSRSWKP